MSAEVKGAAEVRPLYWSVRRELWENRAIYVAPLAAAGLFVAGFVIGARHFALRMKEAQGLDAMQRQHILEQPFHFAALLIMGTTFLVGLFYCLDALYSERRDRSILFWKSLPVSDVTIVLSKASVPLVVLPVVTYAITLVTQIAVLLIGTMALGASGVGAGVMWNELPLGHMSAMLLYHLVAIHAIWYAPFYGWLLLVSGWAKRAPILWATLPLLAIGVVEKIAFNTSYLANVLKYRMGGGPGGAGSAPGNMSVDALTGFTLVQFLESRGLWTGLAFTAICLALAVRVRRYREPI